MPSAHYDIMYGISALTL